MNVLTPEQARLLERLLALAGGDSDLLELALHDAERMAGGNAPTIEQTIWAILRMKALRDKGILQRR